MKPDKRGEYSYDQLFFEYQGKGSARSARVVVPLLINALNVRSVLDVGCGAGAWVTEYQRQGVQDVLGVDGEYVDRSALLFDAQNFTSLNITKSFDLSREYDLVQCLEVGEHIPNSASVILVDNLARHGKHILFSAAVPGQGGENHINEQPYEFWRDLFRERNYRLFDFVRPVLQEALDIEPWYRFNLLFFAHDSVITTLPADVTTHRIPDQSAIRDLSPIPYRLRKRMMRWMPIPLVSTIAKIKHKLVIYRNNSKPEIPANARSCEDS